MKEKRNERMTPKELETRLKEYNPHLIVSTTNDGAAYDVEYVAEDKSRIVLYNFKINKYGKAWGELTPSQLINVRLLIDDYLNEIGDQNYSGDFEVDTSLVPPITMLDPKDLKNTNKHKTNLKGQPKMKSKEQVKRDFIDYLLDQGIGYKVHTSQGIIEQIGIENEAYDTICSINFFNDKGHQVGLYKVGRVDKKQLETILGLYEQILEMMEELMRLKEDGDGK